MKYCRQFFTFYFTRDRGLPTRYKCCADESIRRLAEMVSGDFHAYALSFYEKYDTLEKLEHYFEQRFQGEKRAFRVTREGRKPGDGQACCYAAVLSLLGKTAKLEKFLEENDILADEYKERIRKSII